MNEFEELNISKISYLLKQEIQSVKSISGGRNNNIYKAQSSNGMSFCIKRYNSYDKSCLQREYNTLGCLSDAGICDVPKPLLKLDREMIGVYEWIENTNVLNKIESSHIKLILDFIRKLKQVSLLTNKDSLPVAKDAAFSINQKLQDIENRFHRLLSIKENAKLSTLLESKLVPLYERVKQSVLKEIHKSGLNISDEIPFENWILSPSDFGTHNMLMDANGRLYFIDFEYAGWDDPVSMVGNFIWHSFNLIDSTMVKKIIHQTSTIFSNDSTYIRRLKIQYPLFGVRWGLIFLNEFNPIIWGRRQRVGIKNKDEQIEKVSNIIEALSELDMDLISA